MNSDEQQELHERKWRLYKGTWSVWLPLLSHDRSACVWLITQLHTINGAQPSTQLVDMFSWMRSPQGGVYWYELNEILMEQNDDV